MYSRTMSHPDYVRIVATHNGRLLAIYGPGPRCDRPELYRTWAEVLAVLPMHRPWAIAADYAPVWADYVPDPMDPSVYV